MYLKHTLKKCFFILQTTDRMGGKLVQLNTETRLHTRSSSILFFFNLLILTDRKTTEKKKIQNGKIPVS